MNRKQFADKLFSTLGRTPRIEARENIGKYLREETDEVYLNYDWITDWTTMERIIFDGKVVMLDGEQGVVLKLETDLQNCEMD